MEHFKNHFDPCPNNPQFDGLKVDWKNPTYCNPPYSNPLIWVKKAIEETKKGVNVVMLLRVDVSTRFYRFIIEQKPHIMFINERLKFNDCGKPASFSSMLVFLQAKKEGSK